MKFEGPSKKVENTSLWLAADQASGLRYVADTFDSSKNLRIFETEDGRLFCELKKDPERQAFVATLLKGIIPTCDVKYVETPEGPRYYSYIVPIEKEILTAKHNHEMEADSRLIHLLFDDNEHSSSDVGARPKNIRLDEFGEAVYFDFHLADIFSRVSDDVVRERIENTIEEYPAALRL